MSNNLPIPAEVHPEDRDEFLALCEGGTSRVDAIETLRAIRFAKSTGGRYGSFSLPSKRGRCRA